MKKAKNFSALILISAMLCYWGGVLIGCDNNSGSGTRTRPGTSGGNGGSVPSSYVDENVYAPGFYATHYKMDYVRDVFRDPSYPSKGDTELNVYNPGNPYRPKDDSQYTDSELKNIEYFVLEKAESGKKDCYDEYAVSVAGKKEKIGTDGIIQCLGKEGFLFLCDGFYMNYGTFFFTKYGYDKFTKNKNDMTYKFDKLNLGHADVTEIFGSANN